MSEAETAEQEPKPAPQPGTPEYDQAMADLADRHSGVEPEPAAPAAPAEPAAPEEDSGLILGKYKDQAALEEGYRQLQRKLSEATGEQPEPEPSLSLDAETPADEAETPADPKDSPEDPAPSLDFSRFAQTFAEGGDLSEQDRNDLTKAGIPKEIQDAHLAGLKAIGELRRQETANALGGEETFNSVQKWANENLSDADRAAFNRQLNTASTSEDATLLYSTLQARMAKAQGTEAEHVDGAPPTQHVAGFSSKAELHTATQDPRYETDPAYRKQVETKMANTNWL